MSERQAFPFDAVQLDDGTFDREYASEDFAEYFNKFIGNGIYAGHGNELQVQATTNNMFIQVLDGSCFINGRAKTFEDASIRLSNSDDNYNRFDVVVARLDLINRNITLQVIEGTPSPNPIVPSITRNADIYDLKLAVVTVATGVTEIKQSNVEDTRASNDCGFVAGLLKQIDAASYFEQYNIAMKQEQQELLNQFNEWFATVQNVLDEDTAANLLNMIQKVITGTSTVGNAEKLNGQVGEYYIPTLHNVSISSDMWVDNSYSYAIPSYDENMVIEIKGKSKADVELFNDSEIEYTESNGIIVFTCGTVPSDTLNLAIKVESVVRA